MINKITDKFFVLNNCGFVHGEAKKWFGYRHIALMRGDSDQYIIRDTKRAQVISDDTCFVGSTRGYGVAKFASYQIRARLANQRLDREFNDLVHHAE